MDLNSILDQWNTDCVIDSNDLFAASRDTAKLHGKYLKLYSLAKLQLRKAENDQKKLLKDKWLYYNGKVDQKFCDDRNWSYDPFDGLSKPLKGDMDYFYNADPEIQSSEDLVQYYKTTLDTLKEIIDNLKWRHQTVRNMIEWRRFEEGG